MRCADCKFFEPDEMQCRRYAPAAWHEQRKWLAYHDSELLRDIAFSLRHIAKVQISPDDSNDDINMEATETNFGDGSQLWPDVKPDDWCGEFQAKSTDG